MNITDERKQQELDHSIRPTGEELKSKYGDWRADVGVSKTEVGDTMGDLCRRYGVSAEQFNAMRSHPDSFYERAERWKGRRY